MKLSQKILGLAGVALADYACCPYDDYGIPDAGCTAVLAEKTPFAGSTFQQNDCKAWEFNADAIFEGNVGKCGMNRGQCGFQRQFAWGAAPAGASPAENSFLAQIGVDANFELKFGMGTSLSDLANYDPVSNNAHVFATDYTGGNLGSRSNSNGWGIGKAPALGAVCKLFVPVPPKHIVQVQVAGVHKDGDSGVMFPGTFKANNAASAQDGTVFCFSVVNPSEGDVNDNGVANGNINGRGSATNAGSLAVGDDFNNKNSLERQAGLAPAVNFGQFLVGSATSTIAGTSGNDLNNAQGANFDVVAHFSSDWCARGFGNSMIVEMQQNGDENYGDNSYNIQNDHAHNDVVEKRFAAATYPGTYTVSGNYMTNTVNNNGADTNSYRWPNQGAWAGYHSVVTCAQYHIAADPGNNILDNGYWVHSLDTRAYVMSVSGQDFRQGSTTDCDDLTYRFNVRQVGTTIQNCGPGQLPDADNLRCTWNWNYDKDSSEPETFFDRTDNLVFNTWSGRKRRNAVSHDAANPNVANGPVLSKVNFAFTFNDGAGNNVPTVALSADSSFVTVTGSAGLLQCANNNAVTPIFRDNFPDCFFGDELHFSAVYTAPAPTDPRSRINSWLSTVTVTHPN